MEEDVSWRGWPDRQTNLPGKKIGHLDIQDSEKEDSHFLESS